MLGKTDNNPQLNIGEIPLIHFINQEHELCRLLKKIDWKTVERDFAGFYSNKGAPSIPIRNMVGLILLKKAYGYNDKKSIEQWVENPYWQHFCGEIYFQHKPPLYHSDFSHFKQRIGAKGEAMIASLGNDVFGPAFSRSVSQWNKKRKAGDPKNPISGMVHSLGNFLIRISG